MSGSLIVKVGASTADFRTDIETARQQVVRFAAATEEAGAKLATLRNRTREAGSATKEETAEIKQLETAYKSLSRTRNEAVQDYERLKPSTAVTSVPMPPAPSESVQGGNARMRNQELAHSARSLIDMLGAGANPLQALQMEAPRIVQAFGGGIGAIMGVGAAVAGITALIEKTVEAGEKAKELKRDFQEALRGGPISGQQSAAAISSRIEELDAILHKNNPVTGVMSRAGQFVGDRLASSYEDLDSGDFGLHFGKGSGHDAGREREELVRQAERRRREMLANETKAQAESIDLRERGFTNGQDSTAIAQIDRRTQEQVAALEEKMGIPKLREDFKQARTPEEQERVATELADKERGFHAQKGQIERGGEIDKQEEQRRQQDTANAVQLEEKIVDIKREGLDVDVQIAKARLDAANAALQNGPAGGLENEKLRAAVEAAKQEVEQAEKVTIEKHDQYALEQRIAALRGSSDQVRQRTLEAERADIERRLKNAKPGERPAILTEQAQNQQARDDFKKSKDLRSIDTAETEDRAHAGRSFRDQAALLMKEGMRNDQRRAWNQNENGGDENFAAGLDEKAKELTQTFADLIFAEKQRITSLRNQDTEILGRGYQPTEAMKDRKADADANAQIAQERHGNNDPAVIAAIQRNQGDEKFENAVDEEQLSPAQKRARAKKNMERDQAAQRVRARERRHQEVQAANGHSMTFDELTGGAPINFVSAKQPNRQPDPASLAHTAAAKAGFKGDLATVESLLSDIKENCNYKEQ